MLARSVLSGALLLHSILEIMNNVYKFGVPVLFFGVKHLVSVISIKFGWLPMQFRHSEYDLIIISLGNDIEQLCTQ